MVKRKRITTKFKFRSDPFDIESYKFVNAALTKALTCPPSALPLT